jgi:hypothetical protein
MNRRKFIKSAAGGMLVVTLIPTAFAASHGRSEGDMHKTPRYRIHGNKKLGCSGFDFPDDPAILESGLFMPSM